jgi:hypothetical protein
MSYYGGSGPVSDPWDAAGEDGSDELGPPEPAPGSKGSTALVAVLVSVLVLVLCGGGVTALYLIGAKDRPSTATGPAAPTMRAAASASPSSSPSYDPSLLARGQCVVNDGTDSAPVLRVVGCGPDTFEVLARFDGTTDQNKCKSIPDSNYHYFYDTSPDTLDFVLCLKKRTK